MVDELSAYRKLRDERDRLQAEVALKRFDGGGTLPPVDVDAKIEAAEARTDAKFARFGTDMVTAFGEIKTELAKKPGTGTLVGTALGVVAVLLAAMALGANRFDAGVTVRSAVESVVQEQRERDTDQDKKLDAILKRLPVPDPKKAE